MATPSASRQAFTLPPDDWRLADWVANYRNERASNTDIFRLFDKLARQPDWLAQHRSWVEDHKFGYGDRALHHMWHLIIEHLGKPEGPVSCLEIGVFKGQIISLWALIEAKRRIPVKITALSPFSGSAVPVIRNRFARKIARLVSRRYRADLTAGNIYGAGNYLADCRQIFDQFRLDFSRVELVQGLSTDPACLASLAGRLFDVIYIDGDHSEAVAMHDVTKFAPKVAPGGILVMDDASLSLEMDLPYRGRPGPSAAAKRLPSLGFTNILNIGHNRVFQKN
jgi:hypothetical protein